MSYMNIMDMDIECVRNRFNLELLLCCFNNEYSKLTAFYSSFFFKQKIENFTYY